MQRRHLFAAPLALATGWLHAQPVAEAPPRRYAVISLVGDQMYIVTYQSRTGSIMDGHQRTSVALANTYFDDAVLRAAQGAIMKAEHGAVVFPMRVRLPSLFEKQDAWAHGPSLVVPEELAGALKQTQATHLLLFTKHRADAHLQMQSGYAGVGKLEGLGYYVDFHLRTRDGDTGARGLGLLAPYVYVKAALFDLATLKLLSEAAITDTATLSAARSAYGNNPWDALSSEQKFEQLRGMLEREVTRVVPGLIAADAEHH